MQSVPRLKKLGRGSRKFKPLPAGAAVDNMLNGHSGPHPGIVIKTIR
jgi:hypothetical protein